MAKNPPTGDGHRHGMVKERSQTFNPKTEQYVKREFTNRAEVHFKQKALENKSKDNKFSKMGLG